MILDKKEMMEALSTYIHHDAIAGTAKQSVANDYKFRMLKAIDKSKKMYNTLI